MERLEPCQTSGPIDTYRGSLVLFSRNDIYAEAVREAIVLLTT